jgi:hypothetical protein
MIPSVRNTYNNLFTEDKYRAFLQALDGPFPGSIEFRVAETPVFVPHGFLRQMEETCSYLLELISDPDFKRITERAIPEADRVPSENEHPHFLCFDFAVSMDEDGQLQPQLIELQGFPSLLALQVHMPECYQFTLPVPVHFSYLLDGHTRDSYLELLKDILISTCPVEEVILLEIKPHDQKTRIDFYLTQDYLGIRPVCITELFGEGNCLYYLRDGVKTRVQRIYNRMIFDELHAKKDTLGPIIDLHKDWDVSWITHPNWFYRISKFLLPLYRHPNVPRAYYVNELKQLPEDLHNYVLKPLFSFAGQGVIIDVTPSDLESLPDPEHWILQRKVPYADIIQTPDGPAKCEIRLMYFWKDGEAQARPANNLARLSKGKMIGTRYNQDKTWVGGSACFFPPSGPQ